MSKWKCEICSLEFENFHAQGFNHKIYCPLCYYKELYRKTELERERLNNIINELEEDINDFDVFKEFTFPLMKRDEEQQVKSSIDYEWRKSIKEPFLDKLKELKENKE